MPCPRSPRPSPSGSAPRPQTRPEALISSGVDGIVIAAATDAHTALIRAGVDAGIPVFCEKPLSGVVDEAVAIADYVNASGVPVQIGYPRRFDPAYRRGPQRGGRR